MKNLWIGIGVLVVTGLGYLWLWPVPIDPVAWDAPEDAGYVGVFSANTELADLNRISLGDFHGPEDVVAHDGQIYMSSQDGHILHLDPKTNAVSTITDTGGVPLGMEMDESGHVLVADAHKGLLRVSPKTGKMEVLSDTAGGRPIAYADDLDIASDGTVYFTDASTKFGAAASESTLAASLLEIMEHGRTGRVLAYDPAEGTTRVVAAGFSFPNGLAVTPEDDLLVTITGEYSVLRIDPQTGEHVAILENLPGFPDNINRGPVVDGVPTYLVGIVSPRAAALDDLSGNPGARKMVMRLPEAVRPGATAYTHIIQIDGDGNVLRSLQDPAGGYASATGAVVVGDRLYLSSLTEPELAWTEWTH